MTPVKLKGTAANYVGIALQDSTVLPKLTTKNSSFEKKVSSPSLRPLIDTCQKCSTSPANHEPRSPANGSFQNLGVCPQAVPSFPSPTPTVLFLALAPFSAQAKYRKPRSSVFLCSQTLRKRLLRRLEFNSKFEHGENPGEQFLHNLKPNKWECNSVLRNCGVTCFGCMQMLPKQIVSASIIELCESLQHNIHSECMC